MAVIRICSFIYSLFLCSVKGAEQYKLRSSVCDLVRDVYKRQSLEGERGMPRLKPPFPAAKGFWQKPTDINNVETLANVPWIIYNGGAAFGAMGTEQSKGTKVFALAGKIKKGGLVEVPMGMTLKEVLYRCV